jgi:hypothetical protein
LDEMSYAQVSFSLPEEGQPACTKMCEVDAALQ